MPSRQAHIVPSFHYDVVYLKDFKSYLKQSIEIIDEALDMLEGDAEYTFTIEQTILLEAYWEKRPERREAMKKFASEGRLHVAPGMYVMPDMNMPDGESMFLQALIGFQWLEENLGLKPEVCWIADCWGHHAQLPQILSQCGYKYYAFWRCMDRSLMKNHFLWSGIDGTKLKTHWLSKGYGSIRFPSEDEVVNAADLSLYGCSSKQINALADEMDARGAGGVAMLCNGGDFMKPQPSAPGVVRSLRESGELPGIRFSTPQKYLDALNWNGVQTYSGEFNSAFQGCFSTNIKIKQGVRTCSTLLNAAEKLSAISGKPFPEYGRLLKETLKQQFHDAICGTVADSALAETFKELERTETDLRKAIREPYMSGKTAFLFNPLQFERKEHVEDSKGFLETEIPAFSCVKSSSGRRLVPSAEAPSLPCEFEIGSWKASIGKDGFISSLKEKSSGRELLPASCPHKFGELSMQCDYGDLWLHFDSPLNGGCIESSLTQNQDDPLDRPDAAGLVNRSSFRPSIAKAEIAFFSPELLVIKQSGSVGFWKLKASFETEIRLHAGTSRIDYKTSVMPEGRHFRLRAAFPTCVKGGETDYEIPFGIQHRGAGIHTAQNWMDCSERGGGFGMALLNKGIPGCSVDCEGNVLLNLFRSAAMEYKAESDLSFNDGVPHVFEYAVMPHGDRDYAWIVKEASLFCNPPMELKGDYSAFLESGWGCACENAFISAIRLLPNGEIFARIYEGAGAPAEGFIAVPERIASYAEADGLQRAKSELGPCEGRIPFSLKPFEIKAFILKPKAAR